MPQLTIEQTTEFSDDLVAEIADALGDDSPYLAGLHDHIAHTGRSIGFAARLDGSIAGFGLLMNHEARKTLELMLPIDGPQEVDVARALVDHRTRRVAHQTVEWWNRKPHLDVAEQVALAMGLTQLRMVERMERPLHGDEEAWAEPTRGFSIDDTAEFLRVNNEAFSTHADRANMNKEAFAIELAKLGNCYEDLRLSFDGASASGFCWTKRHDDVTGELYVLATDSAHRGEGLGFRLLFAGLTYLQDAFNSQHAILYVEHSHSHAIALYEKCGFVNVHEPLVAYALAP